VNSRKLSTHSKLISCFQILGIYQTFDPSLTSYIFTLWTPSSRDANIDENKGKDRQCTHNVTLTRVRVTIVVVECHICRMRVCSLMYPACNVQAPYCYLRHVWLYSISPHYLSHGTNFEKRKKIIQHKMCVLFFSTNLSDFFYCKNNGERHDQKRISVCFM
jgi:hypothetical protein